MAPSNRGSDDKILCYHDVVLLQSDLDILTSSNFINDRLIEFFFAHLSPSSTLLLVPPSISFWIAHCPDDPSSSLAPLRLLDRDLIVFTVNDNADVSLAQGGSHWSLLAFDRPKNVFVHLDSCGGLNRWHARKLYEAVRGFVGGGRLLEWAATPQQGNGYDCGLHVMAAARAICRWCEGGSGEEGWLGALREEAAKVPEMRGEILRLITDLMEQQKRNL